MIGVVEIEKRSHKTMTQKPYSKYGKTSLRKQMQALIMQEQNTKRKFFKAGTPNNKNLSNCKNQRQKNRNISNHTTLVTDHPITITKNSIN